MLTLFAVHSLLQTFRSLVIVSAALSVKKKIGTFCKAKVMESHLTYYCRANNSSDLLDTVRFFTRSPTVRPISPLSEK